MSPLDPHPHPPPHLHLAMLSVADSMCQQLWGACPGPRWGARRVGWSTSWGTLGPAGDRPSPCVGGVSADARDSAPGNRASAGCMVAEGQVPRDRDMGRPVFSSRGEADPPKDTEHPGGDQGCVGSWRSPRVPGGSVDRQWTHPGQLTPSFHLPDSGGSALGARYLGHTASSAAPRPASPHWPLHEAEVLKPASVWGGEPFPRDLRGTHSEWALRHGVGVLNEEIQ